MSSNELLAVRKMLATRFETVRRVENMEKSRQEARRKESRAQYHNVVATEQFLEPPRRETRKRTHDDVDDMTTIFARLSTTLKIRTH
mmetsp:Transcript_58402/g.137108  ORF Transcript_58402/g.137108 Transcript_58402/m.137108 type:complete len:87 (-) Transcript_58402:89-349(-)